MRKIHILSKRLPGAIQFAIGSIASDLDLVGEGGFVTATITEPSTQNPKESSIYNNVQIPIHIFKDCFTAITVED